MADALGRRSGRLSRVRALKTVKGRREQRRFAFEGETLLEEARRSGVEVAELYATRGAYETTASVRELDLAGTPTFVIDDSTAAQLSDVETPSGILAVAATRFWSPNEMLERDGILLVLADLNDPGNAGTLLRSADAFAALGVLFGRMGWTRIIRRSSGRRWERFSGCALPLAIPPTCKRPQPAGGTMSCRPDRRRAAAGGDVVAAARRAGRRPRAPRPGTLGRRLQAPGGDSNGGPKRELERCDCRVDRAV